MAGREPVHLPLNVGTTVCTQQRDELVLHPSIWAKLDTDRSHVPYKHVLQSLRGVNPVRDFSLRPRILPGIRLRRKLAEERDTSGAVGRRIVTRIQRVGGVAEVQGPNRLVNHVPDEHVKHLEHDRLPLRKPLRQQEGRRTETRNAGRQSLLYAHLPLVCF